MLGLLHWLLKRHPQLKVTLFVTPDWRLTNPFLTRKLLSAIPYLRDRVFLTKVLKKGTMRLDKHLEFVDYIKNLPHTNLWLELSRPVKNRVTQMLPKATLAERDWMTEQMNVVQQITHLLTYPYVLERYNNDKLNIMGWYYIIETGEIYNYDVEKGYFELING